ncbi:carboxypeptidase-like regulatory domain-containing protein [Catellatospora tritici]|uniref:carboxypeptidase-like regulatory domain-containing protein n=1 Tax=Catellatospora tritici TaxID=2851566 RepID=UPI001C2D7F07|nr:carboxypeptidase-like regulatory domain-containing protein [Catellatospora tritici]MBV1853360.1 carboxypeptidase-like regulatory domain-containing protein [Catellatospora tritici]
MRSHTLRRVATTLLAVTVAVIGLTTPAHADPDTGTIKGQVTANGLPASGITVSAQGWGWGAAVTGSDGRYEITDLPAGIDYRVSFYGAGRPEQYAHQTADYDSATTYTVTAGGTVTVDEVLLPVGTIAGRFTDAAGNPLPNRRVSVIPRTYSHYNYDLTTDANGEFSLDAFAGGYQVSFWTDEQQQYAPGQVDSALAQTFQVTAGQTTTVNETQVGRGAITGRLVRADGTPAADKVVELITASGGYNVTFAYADADGRYRMDAFPGAYRVVIPFGEEGNEINQYVPGKRVESQGQIFTITGTDVITVNETLLPTGTASGRFTDSAGNGIANVYAQFTDAYGGQYQADSDTDGYWQTNPMLAGEYTVYFYDWAHTVSQYAYGKVAAEDADPVTVLAGQNLVVNDTKLATGSIRVTAKNSVTGAPVAGFSVQAGAFWAEERNGAAVLSDLPVGYWRLNLYAEGYQPNENVGPVNVLPGQAEIEVSLVPYASIQAKVVDAATGAPVAGVCLSTQTRVKFHLSEGCGAESGPDGVVTLTAVTAGTYQVFALPGQGSPYGAQWVGLTGGTGDQAQARDVTVTAGQAKYIHKIYLDRKGTITGVVTGADGNPVTSGHVAVSAPIVGDVSRGSVDIDAQGRYTIDFLGPYSWPLDFITDSHAWQWSGAAYKRQSATLVPVVAGQTTTFDQQLQLGTVLKVTATGSPADYFAAAYTSNGDLVGRIWVPQAGGQAVYRVMGGGTVRLHLEGGEPGHGWYGGTSFSTAKQVSIPTTGEKVIVYPYN